MAEYDYRGKNTLTFQRLPGYRKIVAWQAASDLDDQINALVSRFAPGNYRLSNQMRGAVIGISGNIAEGYCSGSLGNYMRYCEIARGSAGELGSYIQDCERWKLVAGDELQLLLKQYSLTTYFLERLIQSLKKKEKESTWDRSHGVKEPRENYRADPPLPSERDYTDEEVSGITDSWPEFP